MAGIKPVVAALIGAAVVFFIYAAVAPWLERTVYPAVAFVGIFWLLTIVLAVIYGVISHRMTQGEFGWKQALGLLAHVALGWTKHWRLVVAVVLIAAGLWAVAVSPRVHTYTEVTGYRYLLEKEYANVIGHVSGRWVTDQFVVYDGWTFARKWYSFPTDLVVTTTQVLRDIRLVEIPVVTWRQAWYLEVGYVLIGLTLIVAGLFFGLYHAVRANNRLMEVCGEHTARLHVNLMRLAGYEVPEGYEEALARFYRTGKADALRAFQGK
jgi:hypothetical protein